jgi:hypothetical protein
MLLLFVFIVYKVHVHAQLIHIISQSNLKDRHNVAEILLKVALNTIKQNVVKHYQLTIGLSDTRIEKAFPILFCRYQPST